MEDHDAMALILIELDEATKKYGKFKSPYEGYAILLEEVDELWEALKEHNHNPDKIRYEAIQVGAMITRFLMDCFEK